jgi:hypothetical protein
MSTWICIGALALALGILGIFAAIRSAQVSRWAYWEDNEGDPNDEQTTGHSTPLA